MKTKKVDSPKPPVSSSSPSVVSLPADQTPDPARHPAATSLPLISIMSAMRSLEAAKLITRTGKGRQLTKRGIAEFLDRELGFSELYAALLNAALLNHFAHDELDSLLAGFAAKPVTFDACTIPVCVQCRTALAKARNDPTAPDTAQGSHSISKKEGV